MSNQQLAQAAYDIVEAWTYFAAGVLILGSLLFLWAMCTRNNKKP